MTNPADAVDLFHAVDGGGNCLPGPYVPFGLVRVGPDMVNHNTSGYASGEDIRHFSHTHVHGMGGQGRAGNIGIAPYAYNPDERSRGQAYRDEEAEMGYYAVTLDPRQGFGEMALDGGIRCELTATHHCAIHRYTFQDDHEASLRIDIGACIGGRSTGGWGRWISPRVLIASSTCVGGWGHNLPYTVYARIELDREVEQTQFLSSDLPAAKGLTGQGASLVGRARLAEADGLNHVTLRVGISYVSAAHAQRHLRDELAGRSFEEVRQATYGHWSDLLGRYVVQGGTEHDRILWHTLWQRLYTMPSDLGTDEVPWFAAQTRQFNDIGCLWDSVRCANSLFALVDPVFATDLCKALIEISEEMGWLPDAWIMGGSAQVQGGCSAAVLFAEALRKKLPGLDPQRALQALMNSQERPSPDPRLQGRYPGWSENGYLSTITPNCTSRSVEYAFHDHCTALLAQSVGEAETAERLAQRAARLWESWSDEKKCFGPRDEKGNPVDFNPWKPECRDFWNDPYFYEGTGHDYALTSWHLIPQLVERHGGAENFAAHLDQFMTDCYHWKEINLHVPWLYHACGMPHRSSRALWQLMDRLLSGGRAGMSDNEDMGAWTSWWITGAMGLCPVPGSAIYLIGCPRFTETQLRLGNEGDVFTIATQKQAVCGDVVQSARLNGLPLHRSWLTHEEICANSLLELELGSEPSNWGQEELPPFAC